jgi:hypothetical protein
VCGLTNKYLQLGEEVGKIYPELQQRKRQKDIFRHIMKERFLEETADSVDTTLKKNGFIFRIRPTKTNWKWKPEIYTLLDNKNLLSKAVNINKTLESKVDISQFRLPSDKYVQLFPSRDSPEQKEQKVSQDNAFLELLEEKEFNELINLYKLNELRIKLLEDKYERLKSRIFQELNESEIEGFSLPNVGSFKVKEKNPDYNLEGILNSNLTKHLIIGVKHTSDYAIIHDLLSDKSISISSGEKIEYEGDTFEFTNNILNINGYPASEELGNFKPNAKQKKLLKELKEDGFSFFRADTLIDGEQLLKLSPISTEKVQHLIDSGVLENNVITNYREIDYEKEETAREKRLKEGKDDFIFELLSEVSELERKNMLKNKKNTTGTEFTI